MSEAGSVTVEPGRGPARATVPVPGDKSLSHRALIYAAMAEGESRIHGLGPGEDIVATSRALQALGVEVGEGIVRSPGVGGWRRPAEAIDCANSGTTMRLLSGALAGRPWSTELVGDESLTRRPMRRLQAPLGILGAELVASESGTPPLAVHGSDLRGADVVLPIASAQVRSAFTFAALQAVGPSRIDSPPGFRDHTERYLAAAGRGAFETATRFRIEPGELDPVTCTVPGDPSSAAFLLAIGAIVPGSEITTQGVSLNPGRTGFLRALEAMGAGVSIAVTGEEMGEPVGDVTVSGGSLTGIAISGSLTVAALDELPLLAVVAAHAEGPTVVADAEELKAKESDRIAATVAMIRALGGSATATEDGFRIEGGTGLGPGTVETHLDHRIAMSAAVAGAAGGPVTIVDAAVAGVSWPAFFDDLGALWE